MNPACDLNRYLALQERRRRINAEKTFTEVVYSTSILSRNVRLRSAENVRTGDVE